jgi:TRAP-type C4-dicarboxylate transport system substrate-binding protein
MRQQTVKVVAVIAIGAALAACQGGMPVAVDKAGAQTLVLRFVDGNSGNDYPLGTKTFIDTLESASGGRMKVDVTAGYENGIADSERDLIHAVAAGQFDGGWPSVRAFASAGIHGLEAVEAPMTLTNDAAVKALVSGPVAADLLGQLDGSGTVGVGLAVGPLRRPFAAKAPLLTPGDWNGIAFRSFDSPVQDATITALGARPVHAGAEWTDLIANGQLGGIEWDVDQYDANGMTTEAPYVTSNVVLWPKVFVFLLNKGRFDSLTDQQRAWVQQAATAATQATVDAPFDESTAARRLCDIGVKFVDASPSQLATLHAAVAPVIAQLAADPVNGPILAKIQAIAAQHPGVDEPDVDASCRAVTQPGPSPSIPTTRSPLADGTYRAQITPAEVTAAGFSNTEGDSGTYTLTVKDGTYTMACRAFADPGVDCGNIPATEETTLEAGNLFGDATRIYFVADGPTELKLIGCPPPPSGTLNTCVVTAPYSFTWSLVGDTLTFSKQVSGLPSHTMVIKPWKKFN